MPSSIDSQRRTVDRAPALILLWNIVGGAFVTLGAPWLSAMAGTASLRPLDVLPSGAGWLSFGVPTHFAGLWLSVVGVYALQRMRRRTPWHLAAALFYAPQTFAITSPVHVDMWIGMFAATSLQTPTGPAIAINWIAIMMLLTHAGLGLLDSRFRAPLARGPAVMRRLGRDFLGSTPLSRAALSRRYASMATLCALPFLPLLPADAFYSRPPLGLIETQYWRVLLLLPMTFLAAYVVAFAWSGGQREARFSARRGVVAALLTYVYLGMGADVLSRGLSDGQEPLFRLFIVAWIYLLPVILLIPAIGAITGQWLARRTGVSPSNNQRGLSRLTAGMWLTLAAPVLALLLSYALGASERNRIESARVVAQRALAHFDQNEPEGLYGMFTSESRAMIDRESFLATIRERRDSTGELQNGKARRELRHRWYPRGEIIQFDYARAGVKGRSSESIVIDVRGPLPAVSAVFMTFEGRSAAHNVFVPRRDCDGRNELLHCGQVDDQAPRSLF